MDIKTIFGFLFDKRREGLHFYTITSKLEHRQPKMSAVHVLMTAIRFREARLLQMIVSCKNTRLEVCHVN